MVLIFSLLASPKAEVGVSLARPIEVEQVAPLMELWVTFLALDKIGHWNETNTNRLPEVISEQ